MIDMIKSSQYKLQEEFIETTTTEQVDLYRETFS